MRMIYWRPSTIPRVALLVIAFLAIAALSSVELIKVHKKKPHYSEKFRASLAMKRGMEVIKNYRVNHVGPIDAEFDPARSGMIGLPQSPITSKPGQLRAKQHTVNPNWGAVMVDLYKEARLKAGDTVAMGFSGSFPALNLAALVAAEVLKLKVIPITSVASSTWGANDPKFTWLDMERILWEEGIITHKSVAASFGGLEDSELGKSKKKREVLRTVIERNGLYPLEFETGKEQVDERMAIYWKAAGESRIAVYVNVGGSTVSVGTKEVKKLFNPGLNKKPPQGVLDVDSVMTRFAVEGLPVIHMVNIQKLLQKYGLPENPVVIPSVGEGNMYTKIEYNVYLVVINLIVMLLVLLAFLKLDIGYRIFGSSRVSQPPKHPEPMI